MYKEKLLLEEYTPLVHRIANGFIRKLPRNVLREDLVAAGMGGLWDAIHRRTTCDDDHFQWYVRVRIRGAILDELRAQDWLPRRKRDAERGSDAVATTIVRTDDLSDVEQKAMFFCDTSADTLLDARREHAKLVSLVDTLPERERFIVAEHYFSGVKFKDLAAELDISEPRISQLHSRALARLRLTATGQKPVVRRRRRPKSSST